MKQFIPLFEIPFVNFKKINITLVTNISSFTGTCSTSNESSLTIDECSEDSGVDASGVILMKSVSHSDLLSSLPI